MTWKTWGYGPVHVPLRSTSRVGYTFPFDSSAGRVQALTEYDRNMTDFTINLRTRIWMDYDGLRPRETEVVSFEQRVPDQIGTINRVAIQANSVAAFKGLTQQVSGYAAAHLLSNLAAVIANFPMEQSVKDQLIVAIVMALPNFDDSEQLKSPVGKFLVRTRDDFMHAAHNAEFQNRRTGLTEYLGSLDTAVTHTTTRKP